MRFLLDEDLPVDLIPMLRSCGHDAWSANEMLKSNADDEVAIYAEKKGAVLLTQDREFARRWRGATSPPIVRLKGDGPDLRDLVLAPHLEMLVALLERATSVDVSAAGVRVRHPWDDRFPQPAPAPGTLPPAPRRRRPGSR